MTETIRFGNFSGLRRSRQWRSSFVPRQATYLAAHRPGVPGRVVTFTDFKTWPNSMPNTTHPPHANGTQGPQGDQITSIEASFVFHWHSLKTRKLSIRPHHREVHRVAAKVTPPPQPGHGAYEGTLWDPAAKIAARANTTVLTAPSHWAPWQRPFPAAVAAET